MTDRVKLVARALEGETEKLRLMQEIEYLEQGAITARRIIKEQDRELIRLNQSLGRVKVNRLKAAFHKIMGSLRRGWLYVSGC